jgi:hypothetical protein
VLTKLEDTVAHGLAITEQARLEAPQSNANPGLRLLVMDGFQPRGERLPTIFRLVSEDFHQLEV